MNTKIILSSIVHKRYGKIQHLFKYKVPSLFIDLDELDIIKSKSKIFSINSFNIFSFYEKDHGYRDGRSIYEFINEKLKSYDVKYNKLKVKILCFPRIFGYVFNPLSIIYCYDDSVLISIFYEVKNTSNEQHTYIFSRGQFNNFDTLKSVKFPDWEANNIFLLLSSYKSIIIFICSLVSIFVKKYLPFIPIKGET